MTKTITIKTADNGVLIETETKYPNGETEQGEKLVFELNESPQTEQEQKQTIEQITDILYHITSELEFSYDKHKKNNLLITNSNSQNIKQLYKDQQLISTTCAICQKTFDPSLSTTMILNLNLKEDDFVCSAECYNKLIEKTKKQKE